MLKKRLVGGMRPSTPLRGVRDNHSQMLLVLSRWSLVLFELSIYKPSSAAIMSRFDLLSRTLDFFEG